MRYSKSKKPEKYEHMMGGSGPIGSDLLSWKWHPYEAARYEDIATQKPHTFGLDYRLPV